MCSVCGISRSFNQFELPKVAFRFFSAEGTFLCQPRVERRESANVAEPWETRSDRTESPNGAALTAKVLDPTLCRN